LDTVETKLFNCLQKVANEGFDMKRMATVIQKAKDNYLLSVEESPASVFSMKLINEAIYGSLDGKTLAPVLKDLVYFDIASKWTSDQWVAFLQKYSS
jgi:Zn-dependent M16 (insulinase) family peptidase